MNKAISYLSLSNAMAARDFRSKYAGTSLGMFWSFIQPAVTVGVYAFVFAVGFKSAPVNNVPYVLWLIAGLVPWLFFSDCLTSCTNALFEYSYLIKKTNFNASLLPIIKALSSLRAHVVFSLLAVAAFWFGYKLNVYAFQIIYYSFCILLLALSLGYLFSALSAFFKDALQVVGILVQIGFWATPIAWDIGIMSENIRFILQLNPVFYVVQGFRDSFISNVWFFQRPMMTLYFFSFVLVSFLTGYGLFKKMRPHFGDLL